MAIKKLLKFIKNPRKTIKRSIKQLKTYKNVIRDRFSFQKSLDPQKTFSEIYEKRKWGSSPDDDYGSSGQGSHKDHIVNPYIEVIDRLSRTEGFEGMKFVDLGCGDFNVGKSIHRLSKKYIGVDVVEDLINRNRSKHSKENLEFICLDIVNDPLPEGDVCFLRQVLQHLSNEQIKTILQKLKSYKWVFITEHYPSSDLLVTPNLDKRTGSGIRLQMGSGVYLTEAPFLLDPNLIKEVLEVKDGWGGKHSGSIKTFMYQPIQNTLE